MEENKISVYVKVNSNNEIVVINSDIFIRDFSDWIKIDEGTGDRFAHAQGNYLGKSLINNDGNYNYKLINGKVQEVTNG